MSAFAREAATALRLISAKGSTVTFTRKGDGGVFNPVTQETTPAQPDQKITMKAVGIAPGKSAEFKIGTLVGRNIIELHCAPNLKTPPERGDTFEWGGKVWSVIYVDELNPDGKGAVYTRAYAER